MVGMHIEKSELRKTAKAARDAANADLAGSAPKALALVLQMEARKLLATTVPHGSYRPIRSEISTVDIHAIWADDLSFPCVVAPAQPLVFRRWAIGDPFMKGAYGIEEPLPTAQTVTPQLIFVPLLAFDARGYRLGYGGGFYDRTIAELRASNPDFCAIGLAYDEQEVENILTEPTDMALDAIATPTRFIEPASARRGST